LDSRFALPTDTVLDTAYRIVRVVGSGGFGITYEAEDISLGISVALKEYYPDEFGDRDARMSVRPKSERHRRAFEWGRENFLREARTLARFEHPSIVRVTRVFEANSTAYMVMGFERGQSFEAWLKGLGRLPTQEELDTIVAPLLDALEIMHAEKFLHRDIAPDNIIVRADGTPVLLDFGAARRAVAEMSRSLTGIIKPGYSPHEQYANDGRLQGPWSDLYALGGTLYRAVTGHAPEEATLRVDDDHMAPAMAAVAGTYRPGFLAAIDACLKVRHADRPRSVAQLRPMLLGLEPEQPIGAAPVVNAPMAPSKPLSMRRSGPSVVRPIPSRWAAVTAAALLVGGGSLGAIQFMKWQPHAAAEAQRKVAADHARRRAALDAERQQKEAADAARRQAEQDAQRRRLEEERIAAEALARKRAEAEAEDKRKEEERRRIASREEATPPPVPPRSGEPVQPQGRLLKLRVRFGSQPNAAKKVWLGVEMEALQLPLARALGRTDGDGVLVSNVATGNPAAQAGLRFGDIIVGLNNRAVTNVQDFRQRVASAGSGSEVTLHVWRFGEASDFLQTLRRLADGGDADCMYRLGRLYASGHGTRRDDAEAVGWFRRGADAGNMDAEAALAVVFLEGRGTAMDRQDGLRRLKAAAAKGQVDAMNRLGHILLDGGIAERDPVEAVRLFTQAAEAGHTPSMVDLAELYHNGNGIEADPSKAALWYRRAAELGDPGGTAGLASLYEHGNGVEKDIAKAVSLFRQAADEGNANGMTGLGLLLVQGKGVTKNDATGAEYFRKAAALGNPIAMNNLAWMLQIGYGVPRKDPEEAAELMMKALDHRFEFSYEQMTQSSHAWSKEFRQAMQRRLRDAGVYTGAIDGEFRQSTLAAIDTYFHRVR